VIIPLRCLTQRVFAVNYDLRDLRVNRASFNSARLSKEVIFKGFQLVSRKGKSLCQPINIISLKIIDDISFKIVGVISFIIIIYLYYILV
jgi:hypothetical protein